MTRSATSGFSLERRGTRRARGFTLVELMIAIAIALFLIGGILTLVQSTRNAFATQTTLAQFQDNQRLTMTFMAEVIESAGYFPDPFHNTVGAVLPPVVLPPPIGAFTVAGQGVLGSPGDTITVRFGAGLNDNVFGCNGAQNLTVNPYDVFISTFSVDPVNQQLVCTLTNGAGVAQPPVILVNQVTNLQAVYGVKRSPADTGSCTDTYLTTAQMLGTDWPNVCSISVTVTFVNPLSKTGTPVSITRVIAVMSAAGVNS
jgi:type IV pilus assembly protein PilW